ncbi:unnamed protein product [Urochloa humidicola]
MDPTRFPSPPSPSDAPSTNGEVADGPGEAPSDVVDGEPVHVFISPVVPVAADGAEAAAVLPPVYTGVLMVGQQREDDDPKKRREKWLNEMRGWLVVVAVLVASVTYQSGLSPPGGFWQDSSDGHIGGAPVLESNFPRRYTVFFYFNATAFLTSLAIIVLLMNESFYHSESKVVALEFLVVLDMVMLMGAYLAGSTRTVITTIYTFVFAVVVLVSVYAVYTAQFMSKLWGLIAGVLWARGDGGAQPVPDRIIVETGAHRPPDSVGRS